MNTYQILNQFNVVKFRPFHFVRQVTKVIEWKSKFGEDMKNYSWIKYVIVQVTRVKKKIHPNEFHLYFNNRPNSRDINKFTLTNLRQI